MFARCLSILNLVLARPHHSDRVYSKAGWAPNSQHTPRKQPHAGRERSRQSKLHVDSNGETFRDIVLRLRDFGRKCDVSTTGKKNSATGVLNNDALPPATCAAAKDVPERRATSVSLRIQALVI